MHRFLGAALAAFLVLPVCADAKTVRIPPHRLALAPGMSVDIPDGWMACDPESNKALHHAPHIVAIEGFCGSVRARHERDTLKADIHMFIDSDPSTSLLMGSFFLSGFAVP